MEEKKMGIGNVVKCLALGGGLAALVGCGVGYMTKPEGTYTINRQGAEVSLVAKDLGKAYPLKVVADDFYMGDSLHNLNGARAMVKYEMKPVQPAQPEVAGGN